MDCICLYCFLYCVPHLPVCSIYENMYLYLILSVLDVIHADRLNTAHVSISVGGGRGTRSGKGYRLRCDRWRAVAVTTRDG